MWVPLMGSSEPGHFGVLGSDHKDTVVSGCMTIIAGSEDHKHIAIAFEIKDIWRHCGHFDEEDSSIVCV